MTTAYQPGQRVRGQNFVHDTYLNFELGTIHETILPGDLRVPFIGPCPFLCYVVDWDNYGIQTHDWSGVFCLSEHSKLFPIDEDGAKRETDSIINRLKHGVPA